MSQRIGLGAVDHGEMFVHLQRPTANERRRPSTGSGVGRVRGLSNGVAVALMLLTSTLAVFDLYLLASSALH